MTVKCCGCVVAVGWLVLYESYEMGLILVYLAFVVCVCVFLGICFICLFLLGFRTIVEIYFRQLL